VLSWFLLFVDVEKYQRCGIGEMATILVTMTHHPQIMEVVDRRRMGDGSDRINRENLWRRWVSGGSEKISPNLITTSYSRKESEDNSSFLAKLREEASPSI
jgi:hypothetical protein